MEYTYIICPKCMDGLIERREADVHKAIYCSKCGNKLVPALYGEKRIDETKYRMTMNGEVFTYGDSYATFRKDLEMVDFDIDAIIQILETGSEGSILYEGDAYHTYMLMLVLNGTVNVLNGCTVTPEFPFTFALDPMVALCPACGCKTVEKVIPDRPNETGYYCEKCNEWVMGSCL